MFLRGRIAFAAPRVFTTLLIFSLSAGVLGGILIYFDSAGPLILNEMSEGSYYDMKVELSTNFHIQDEISIEDVLQAINNQSGVSSAEHIIMIRSSTRYEIQKVLRTYAYVGVNEAFLNEFSNVIQLSDDCYPLVDNGCYVDVTEFNRLGLEINGTYPVPIITGEYFYHTTTRNFTVQGTFTSNGPWGVLETQEDVYPILRMVTSIEALENNFGYLGYGQDNALYEEVWVNYNPNYIKGISPIDLQSGLELDRQHIDQRIVPYASVSEFALLSNVYIYSSWQASIRSIAIAFSIPTIIMAIMLIQYSSNLVNDTQRQEAGSLRIRGASGWQVFRWIMSMALFTGVVGSLGAILMGYLAALLSGSTVGLMAFDFSILQKFEIILNPLSLLAVFLFTFIVGAIITLPSAVKIIIIEINDAHRMLEQETTNNEGMVNWGIEAAIVVLSGLTCFVLLNATDFLATSNLLLSAFFIFAFGAFAASLAHLFSRPASYIKSRILYHLKNPELASVARPIGRTSIVKRRSDTIGIMFISMVFVAGIFSSLSANSGSVHSRELIMFNTGADIVVETNPLFHNMTLDVIPQIKTIDGVTEASGVYLRYEHVLYQAIGPYSTLQWNRTMLIIGVQPDTWMRTAFWLPYFTSEMTPDSALSILSETDGTALSSFKPINGFELVDDKYQPLYGDFVTLQLGFASSSKFVNLTIIDVLSTDPSDESPTYLPGMPDAEEFLIVNIDVLHEFYNTTELDLVYLALDDGTNCTQVSNQIRSLYPDGFTSIRCAQDQISTLEDSSMSRSIIGVFTINILFSLLYLTVGMAIVAVEKNQIMRSDFSLLRAFGLRQSRIIMALLIETAISIGYAALIGGSIGFILSFLILNSPVVYIGITDVSSWSRLPVTMAVPWNLLISQIVVSFVLPLFAVLVVNTRAFKRKIAADLQIGIG
jgi:ABC-type lipoprotein release transport system permease subunit